MRSLRRPGLYRTHCDTALRAAPIARTCAWVASLAMCFSNSSRSSSATAGCHLPYRATTSCSANRSIARASPGVDGLHQFELRKGRRGQALAHRPSSVRSRLQCRRALPRHAPFDTRRLSLLAGEERYGCGKVLRADHRYDCADLVPDSYLIGSFTRARSSQSADCT